MRRAKKGEVGNRNPEVAERTWIPVGGPQARMGAAAYLAVLAYPGREEWPKRDEFMEAVKALLLKRAIRRGYGRRRIKAKYRQFPNKRINQILHRTFRRILHRRMLAGMAGNWMVMDGARFGPFVLPGNIPVGGMTLKAPNSPLRAMKEIYRLLSRRGGWNVERDRTLWNLQERVWRDSLPVLHLAMVVAEFLNTDQPMLRLILEPSWVGDAVRQAEALRTYLAAKVPSFNPLEAIQLAP